MTTTPRGAPELAPSQAVPETTVNEQIRRTEAGMGRYPVADRITAPPGSCADGASYIIISAATGAFAGKEGQIATAVGTNAASGWLFRALGAIDEGVMAYVQDEDAEYKWDGSSWAAYGGSGYSPGGTDVAVADGGTGASTAAGARTNLDVYSTGQVDSALAAAVTGLLDLKGSTDCSANPNYPAASKGDFYLVSVAGKIGGASGTSVDVGDAYFALADNAGGTEASVGTSWAKLEHNGVYGAGATASSTTQVLTGTDIATVATPDAIAALWEQGSDVASAGTVSLGEGGYFNITGTTTITDIDFATDKAGRAAWIKFAGALTLTHNASTLILPTGANITTMAGDTACFVSEGSDVVRCVAYQRASGAALAGSSSGPSIQSVTSSATVTPTFSDDQVNITAQAAGLSLANPTGTAVDGWAISIRIKDNGTARSISFGTQYRSIGVTLPTTTVVSKTLYLGMIFNNADTKWDVVAVAQEA
jgi:hypothetical protein